MTRIEQENPEPNMRFERALDVLRGVGEDMGQTPDQIEEKLDELFSAYPGAWSIYLLLHAKSAILTAIENDTTITWLDVDVNGVTLRQRILNNIHAG